MDKGDDPYEILGVSYDATETEIKKAYRKGALKYHPDKQQTEEDKVVAGAIFTKMADAYDTLTDTIKRYDWKQANEHKLKGGKTPTPTKRASAPTAQKRQTAPVPQGANRGPPPPQQKRTSAMPPGANRGPPPPQQKRQSAMPAGANRAPAPNAQRRTSAPVQTGANRGPPPPQQRPSAPVKHAPSPQQKRQSSPAMSAPRPKAHYRDPFDIFDNVMKEEFGEDYKHEEKSGWGAGKGVLGLAKLPNPFGKKGENTHKEFKKLDINKDKSLSKDELRKYIESHADLWTMLGVNLDLSIKRCLMVATDVAFNLATGVGERKPLKNEHRDEHRELTEQEFKHFHKNYILDEKGSKEFFLRTIFAAFDLNGDGVLQKQELTKFLDIFYDAKDVFKGKMRLPPKAELHRVVMGRLDKNRDGCLTFFEMKDLLEVAAFVASDNS